MPAPEQEQQQLEETEGPAERGRYAVNLHPDGSIAITRATGICDTCQSCGCGTPADPIRIPAALAHMARMAAEGKMKLPSIGQLRQMQGAKGPRGGRR